MPLRGLQRLDGTVARTMREVRGWVKSSDTLPSARQLFAYTQVLFPSSSPQQHHQRQIGSRPRSWRSGEGPVSPGWMEALTLVELASQLDTTGGLPDKSCLSSSAPTLHTEELRVVEHVLAVGVFPPAGWQTALQLLQRWHTLSSTNGIARSEDLMRWTPNGTSAPPVCCAVLPAALSPQATLHLLRHISMAPTNGPSWRLALTCYSEFVQRQFCTTRSTTRPSSSSCSSTLHDVSGQQVPHAVRHVVLTTLLRSGQWAQAVQFYAHALYQRDMPSPVTTGHLVQELGAQGQWEAVLRVYDVCVKLLQAQASLARTPSGNGGDPRAKSWGTTLSMAMRAVTMKRPHQLEGMLVRLSEAGKAVSSAQARFPGDTQPTRHRNQQHSSSSYPLALLDGNFLAAVQSLTPESARVPLLRLAKEGRLLDYFKLVRGLTSRGQWLEAMAAYAEAALASCSPSLLSRRELGQCRLEVLHASSQANVRMVVAVLNRIRASTPAQSTARPSLLSLNDREVECVLSKSLDTDSFSPSSAASEAYPGKQTARGLAKIESFWRYCLHLLQENYPADFSAESTLVNPRSSTRRHLTPSMASLFLKNRDLPWREALHVVSTLHLLNPSAAASVSSYAYGGTPLTSSPPPRSSAPPVEVLVLNAAADLLYSQGKLKEASELAVQAVRWYGASPSAMLLLHCPEEQLVRLLLREGRPEGEVGVDPRVLFYLLHTCATDTEGCEVEKATLLPRVLLVVSLLMEHECGSGLVPHPELSRVSHKERGTRTRSWLECVPASVHCEALRVIRRLDTAPAEYRQQLTLAYMRALTTPSKRRIPQHLCEAYYCATYEAVLTLLGLPGVGPARLPLDLLEVAVARHGCLPPAHMLLSNQVDRLIPALNRKSNNNNNNVHTAIHKEDAAAAVAAAAAARHLVLLTVAQLELEPYTHARSDPVLLHGLLKLSCRAAEHAAAFLSLGPDASLGGDERLCKAARQVLEWMAQRCGPQSVSPGGIGLYYQLCAAQHPQQWEAALSATQLLVQLQADAVMRTEPASSQCEVVGARQYHLYESLFGWERGLLVWYRHQPREVLLRVSWNSTAVNACLSVSGGG